MRRVRAARRARSRTWASRRSTTARAPLGWSVAGGADVASRRARRREGERSLKVTRAAPAGVTRVTQRVPAALLRRRRRGTRAARAARGFVRAAPAVPPRSGCASTAARPVVSRQLRLRPRADASRTPLRRRPRRRRATAWRRYEIELPLPDDVDEVAFGVSVRGQGSAWFDALELTRRRDGFAAAAPAPAAVRYLDAALALMREHSLRRAERRLGQRARASARACARRRRRAADAHLAVRFAVRELGDRHSYLQSAAVSRARCSDGRLERAHGRCADGAARPAARRRARLCAGAGVRGRHAGAASRVRRRR